jgi:AraC-like DNA-binding protein
LAAACAVPERTLLKQFKRFVGLSPLAYLRRMRLNLARSELLQADCETAISEVAIGCGFTHLGRFATEYRRAFGESPSATRQRLRGNSAADASLPTAVAWRAKPVLLLVPFRTETLQEELEARDLMERLGATLARMRQCHAGASVPRPVVRCTAAARWRHALCPDGPPKAGR